MTTRLYRYALLTAYQFALVAGIAMLPVALLTRRVGLTPPIDPLIERLGDAYDEVAESDASGAAAR
jgi:hypothetical protein